MDFNIFSLYNPQSSLQMLKNLSENESVFIPIFSVCGRYHNSSSLFFKYLLDFLNIDFIGFQEFCFVLCSSFTVFLIVWTILWKFRFTHSCAIIFFLFKFTTCQILIKFFTKSLFKSWPRLENLWYKILILILLMSHSLIKLFVFMHRYLLNSVIPNRKMNNLGLSSISIFRIMSYKMLFIFRN